MKTDITTVLRKTGLPYLKLCCFLSKPLLRPEMKWTPCDFNLCKVWTWPICWANSTQLWSASGRVLLGKHHRSRTLAPRSQDLLCYSQNSPRQSGTAGHPWYNPQGGPTQAFLYSLPNQLRPPCQGLVKSIHSQCLNLRDFPSENLHDTMIYLSALPLGMNDMYAPVPYSSRDSSLRTTWALLRILAPTPNLHV